MYVVGQAPNVNIGLQIEYDSSWLGLHCFESYPCRHVVSEVLNIKTSLLIEYDSFRLGLHSSESYRCVVGQAPNVYIGPQIE